MGVENKKVKNENANKGLVISFSNDYYLEGFDRDHDDPMARTTTIHNYPIKRVLIDQGSLINISYNVTTTSMNIQRRDL